MADVTADVEAHAHEYLDRLRRACAQSSVSTRGEGVGEMARLAAEMLQGAGFDVESVPTAGAPVILGRLEGQGVP